MYTYFAMHFSQFAAISCNMWFLVADFRRVGGEFLLVLVYSCLGQFWDAVLWLELTYEIGDVITPWAQAIVDRQWFEGYIPGIFVFYKTLMTFRNYLFSVDTQWYMFMPKHIPFNSTNHENK